MQKVQIEITGYSISTDWYEGLDNSDVIIMIPGYNSSKARISSFAKKVVKDTNNSVLAIDLSGHGESPFNLDDTRPAQHFLELIYVFDWVHSNYPDAEITVEGSSYGGFLVTYLTKYRDFAKAVLIAPAIYRPEEFYNKWGIRRKNEEQYTKVIAEYRKNKNELAQHPLLMGTDGFNGKVLVVEHENDVIVPVETTQAYIDAFRADRIVAAGFLHSFNDESIDKEALSDYFTKITSWLVND